MLFIDARQSYFYISEGPPPKMIPILVFRDGAYDPWQPMLAQRNMFYRGTVFRL